MRKQVIRLNEATLRRLVAECIEESIENSEIEEGFLDNVKAGTKSAFGKGVGSNNSKNIRHGGGLNLNKRWRAAKAGYNAKNTNDKIDNVVSYLNDLINQGKIDPNQTVEQLVKSVGGEGKFAKGNFATMKARNNSVASKAQNDIYR